MASTQEWIDELKSISVLELAGRIKAREEGGGGAATAVAAAAPAAADGGGGAAEEEASTTVDVVLTGAGDKKIQVIKVVRAATRLGLKEAKALVDEPPKPIKEGIERDEAEKLKAELEEAGGSLALKELAQTRGIHLAGGVRVGAPFAVLRGGRGPGAKADRIGRERVGGAKCPLALPFRGSANSRSHSETGAAPHTRPLRVGSVSAECPPAGAALPCAILGGRAFPRSAPPPCCPLHPTP